MPHRTITISRGMNLPHWQTDEGTYFVTFRLLDSLPADLARMKGGRRVEEALDRGLGASHLARSDIGSMVFHAMRFFDGKRYTLHNACVMPNHVHAVFRTAPRVRLSVVMRAWKGFTATQANRLLERKGAFWQRESFDRLIRDENEVARANAYVLANPEKAGLRNWKWVREFDSRFAVKYDER
jgi:REP element-mobilizing transposase RayT